MIFINANWFALLLQTVVVLVYGDQETEPELN